MLTTEQAHVLGQELQTPHPSIAFMGILKDVTTSDIESFRMNSMYGGFWEYNVTLLLILLAEYDYEILKETIKNAMKNSKIHDIIAPYHLSH